MTAALNDIPHKLSADGQSVLSIQDALRSGGRFFQGLFDSARDLLFILKANGAILYANRTAQERLGYTLEEMDGRNLYEFLSTSYLEGSGEVDFRLWAGEQDLFHLPLMTKTGETIQTVTRLTREAWNGQEIHMAACRDVTAETREQAVAMALRDLGFALNKVVDRQEAYQMIVAAALQVSGMDRGAIFQVDAAAGSLGLAYQAGQLDDPARMGSVIPASFSGSDRVLRGESLYLSLPEIEALAGASPDLSGLTAIVRVPIICQGKVVAALQVASTHLKEVPAASHVPLEVIGQQMGAVIGRLEVEDTVQQLNRDLENRVEERTRQLEQANAALRKEIAERKRVELALRRKAENEKLVAGISARLISLDPDDMETEIQKALEKIGSLIEADRSYIVHFLPNQGFSHAVYEWCAPGVPSQNVQLNGPPGQALGWWLANLANLETVNIPNVDDLPHEAQSEKDMLRAQGVQSMVALPIIYQNYPIGFLGFDAVHAKKSWPGEDLSLLKMVSEIFAIALQHKQTERALIESDGRNQALIEALPDPIFMMDEQGTILDFRVPPLYWKDPFPEQILKHTYHELVPADVQEAFTQNFERAKKTKAIEICEYTTHVREQSYTYEVRIAACGENRYFAILRDITKRKQVEQASQHYAERLEFLHEIDRAVLAAGNPTEVSAAVLQSLERLIPNQRAQIVLFADDPGVQIIVNQKGTIRAIPLKRNLLMDYPEIASVLRSGNPYFGKGGTEAARMPDLYRAMGEDGVEVFVSIPLIAHNKLIGVLNLGSDRKHPIQAEIVKTAAEVADSLAVALQQMTLLEKTRLQANRLQLVDEITRTALETEDLQTLLDQLARHLKELLKADSCYIALWDEDHQVPIPMACFGAPQEEYLSLRVEPGEPNLTSAALAERRVLEIDSSTKTGLMSQRLANTFPEQATLALPLMVGEKKLGAALVSYDNPHHVTEEEVESCEQIATKVSLAIAKALLLESEKRRRSEAETLQKIMAEIVSSRDLSSLLAELLNHVVEMIPTGQASIYLETGETLVLAASRGQGEQPGWSEISPQAGLFRKLTGQEEYLLVDKVQNDPDFEVWNDSSRRIQSWLCVPLAVHGRRIGYLTLDNYASDPFSNAEIQLAKAFAVQAAVGIENARLFEQAHARVHELEAVTGVTSALRKAKTREQMLAILVEETLSAGDSDAAAIFLIRNHQLTLEATGGLYQDGIQPGPVPGEDPLWKITLDGEPAFLLHPDPTDRVPGQDYYTRLAFGMASLALLPLRAADEPVGLICLGRSWIQNSSESFTTDEQRVLVSIAEMAGNALNRIHILETLEERVVERTRDLTVLYEITAVTSQALPVEEILNRSLEKLMASVPVKMVMLHVLDERKAHLHLMAHSNVPQSWLATLESIPLQEDIFGKVILQNTPQIVADIDRNPAGPLAMELPKNSTHMGIPIRMEGQPQGVLSLLCETDSSVTLEHLALLSAVADHLGIALEGARLRHQAEDMAVMEERQRLARELHDSVTQSLYSLTLLTEGWRRAAHNAQLSEVESWLAELGQVAYQSLKEMRLLLYELRPSTLERDGLLAALRRRLEAVERRSGIQAQLVAEQPVRFPPPVEVELYHLGQEALNNAIKHSEATQVQIRCTILADQKQVLLEISDNGKGFRLEEAEASGGMGLTNMRERADRLGGRLIVDTNPGEGTRVKVYLPAEWMEPYHE